MHLSNGYFLINIYWILNYLFFINSSRSRWNLMKTLDLDLDLTFEITRDFGSTISTDVSWKLGNLQHKACAYQFAPQNNYQGNLNLNSSSHETADGDGKTFNDRFQVGIKDFCKGGGQARFCRQRSCGSRQKIWASKLGVRGRGLAPRPPPPQIRTWIWTHVCIFETQFFIPPFFSMRQIYHNGKNFSKSDLDRTKYTPPLWTNTIENCLRSS